jgi:hypothetical protein
VTAVLLAGTRPAALGTFRGYELLQGRVSQPCNKHIGDTIELEFLRTGAIVFFRWLVGVSGRDGLPRSDAIKQFIWEGGDVTKFVQQRSDQFVKNFKTSRPTKWMHILAVERTYDVILAHAQFFAGPRIIPPPYVIRVGRRKDRFSEKTPAHTIS